MRRRERRKRRTTSIGSEEEKQKQRLHKTTHLWTLLDLFLFLRPKVLSSTVWYWWCGEEEGGRGQDKGEFSLSSMLWSSNRSSDGSLCFQKKELPRTTTKPSP